MGPVRGAKRRRVEKKVVVGDGLIPSSEQELVDWWDSFSKRIAGSPLSCFFFFCSFPIDSFGCYLALVGKCLIDECVNTFIFLHCMPLCRFFAG